MNPVTGGGWVVVVVVSVVVVCCVVGGVVVDDVSIDEAGVQAATTNAHALIVVSHIGVRFRPRIEASV